MTDVSLIPFVSILYYKKKHLFCKEMSLENQHTHSYLVKHIFFLLTKRIQANIFREFYVFCLE